MPLWILLAIAGLLLLLSFARERFEATPSIKAPPYDAAEKRRMFDMVHQKSPRPPYTFLGYQDILMTKAKAQLPAEAAIVASTTATAEQKRTAENKLKEAAGAFVSPAIESFFTTVFKPATTPITKAQVDSFVDARVSDINMIEKDILSTYFVGQSGVGTSERGGANSYAATLATLGQNAGYLVTSPTGSPAAGAAGTATASGGGGVDERGRPLTGGLASPYPDPMCPTGKIRRQEDGKCVDSAPGPASTCPDGYDPVSATSMKCIRTGGTEIAYRTRCPTGYEFNELAKKCDTLPVDPTCPGGFTFGEGRCTPDPSRAEPAAPTSSGPATTTGGSSTSTYGPTTGGPTNRIRQVFGPQFTGTGGEIQGPAGDSSTTNVYPELLGGLMDTSSRIPGAGIRPPSKNWALANDGTLPSSSAMGSDEMSRYFPFSRSPGDMDVLPDPYRVAQTFSPSSYSSKTEPVPFLTDFSAFQK